MPRKSSRADRGRATYRRKKVTGREPLTSASTDQTASMEAPILTKKQSALEAQSEDKRYSANIADWRRTLILGGSLLIVLIVVSLILRYTLEI